jgi:hypothetical protein
METEFFELIQRDGIKIRSHTGCYYDPYNNIYYVGDHRDLETTEQNNTKYEDIPAVCLYIEFSEESAKKYYELILRSLFSLQNIVPLQIIHRGPTSVQILKEEYRKDFEKCQRGKEDFRQRIEKIINQLNNLGVSFSDFTITYPSTYDYKPEWFAKEISYQNVSIEIRFHIKTSFYRTLKMLSYI